MARSIRCLPRPKLCGTWTFRKTKIVHLSEMGAESGAKFGPTFGPSFGEPVLDSMLPLPFLSLSLSLSLSLCLSLCLFHCSERTHGPHTYIKATAHLRGKMASHSLPSAEHLTRFQSTGQPNRSTHSASAAWVRRQFEAKDPIPTLTIPFMAPHLSSWAQTTETGP
jgi:hypothetical protein